MFIAVITLFFRTPASWFQQCLDSVAQQTIPCTHIVVCDGSPFPGEVNVGKGVQVITMPKSHGDVGNAARAVGSVSAICQGFDAIAYLDSDNWYAPAHLQRLCEAQQQAEAVVGSASRNLVDLEGRLLGLCCDVDGDKFVDTNCMFLTRPAFGITPVWYLMPSSLVETGDQVMWAEIIKAKFSRVHLREPTVSYRSNYALHYLRFGRQPPPKANPGPRFRNQNWAAARMISEP